MKKNPYAKYKILYKPPKKGDVLLFNNRHDNDDYRLTETVFASKNTFYASAILRFNSHYMSRADETSRRLINGEFFIVSDVISALNVSDNYLNLILDEEDIKAIKLESYWAERRSSQKYYKLIDSDMKVFLLSYDYLEIFASYRFRVYQKGDTF